MIYYIKVKFIFVRIRNNSLDSLVVKQKYLIFDASMNILVGKDL